ncbi:hypothetical protein B0T10DRAFT_125683 [Thelonectria olida]|uniref:PSI domain-containing protein n=1 Tax=Thelonectria olida TaxID=1576542 RepID=A0A9P9AVL2_9HYPO|nr:hypothetical protein B0T10DRAFT_125683 [Thelonectria olida]
MLRPPNPNFHFWPTTTFLFSLLSITAGPIAENLEGNSPLEAMDATEFSLEEIQAYRSNFTVDDDKHEHLLRCWSRQTCDGCLNTAQCSWCPFTWSCVPNSHAFPALAPAYDENICPHWAERWEIRTRPLGCQVSTITSLTAIVSVLSTLVFIGLVFGVVVAIRRLRRFNKEHPGWLGRLRLRVGRGLQGVLRRLRRKGGEREPLLQGHRNSDAHSEGP